MLRKEVERIFAQVKNSLIDKQTIDDKPTAILLGGQPASGKSCLIEKALKENPEKSFIIVNGDIYRTYHPAHEQLILQPKKYSSETQLFSNVFTEKLIEEALKNKYNIIIEGTMRNPDIPQRTAIMFKSAGFKVDIYAISAPQQITNLGIYNRYQEEVKSQGYGRLADIYSHNEAVKGLNKSLDALFESKVVDNIYLYNLFAKEKIASFILNNNKWNHWQNPSHFIESSRLQQLNDKTLLNRILDKGEQTLTEVSPELKENVNKAITSIQNILTDIDNSISKGIKL